jgi:hypothetical protein
MIAKGNGDPSRTMLTLAKQRELSRFLAALPARHALQLAALAERKRIAGERDFPADLILDALRPTLAEQEALRTPTPQRLFCEPFADFLVDDREIKQPGRIARSSVRVLWRWLAKDAMGPALHELEAQIADAVLAENLRLQDELLQRLRRNVVNVIRIATAQIGEQSSTRDDLAARLGGEDVLIDLEEIAFLLAADDDLLPLRELLPRRIDTLTDEQVNQVLAARTRLGERKADLVPYLGLLLLARLGQPWQALRLTGSGRRGRSDFTVVGDILIADAEGIAVDIAATQLDILNPDTLAAKFYRFERLTRGLALEMRNRHGTQWTQALQRIKDLAHGTLEGLFTQAPREVAAALPLTKVGTFSVRRQRQPDLTGDPDPMKLDRALRWTCLLANTASIAPKSALAVQHKKAFEAVSAYLSSYAESAAAELKSPDIEKHTRVQAYLKHADELLNTLIAASEDDDFQHRVAM